MTHLKHRLLILILLVLVAGITATPGWGADVTVLENIVPEEIELQVHWNESFLVNPTLTYLGKSYTLNTLEGDGVKLLERLYKGRPQLEKALEEALLRGRFLSIYSVSSTGLMGLDFVALAAGNPISFTWIYTGIMFKLLESYVFPVSHYDLLKRSIELYNQRLIKEAKQARQNGL